MGSVIVGIDPGKDGAIVFLGQNMQLIACVDTPTFGTGKGSRRDYSEAEMVRILRQLTSPGAIVVLETQQAMPGQGVSSTFSTGVGFGLWRGIIAALGLARFDVRPAAWTKAMGLTKSTKAAHCEAAKRLLPELDCYGPRGGTKDGRADAALLAIYGLRQHAVSQ